MNGPKVALLVEDNLDNRTIFKYLLQQQGFEVTEAKDGLDALQILKLQTFDLMVLDLLLPNLDGGAVLEGILRVPAHQAMKVIVVTAASNWHRMEAAVEARADYFMQKPINIDDFNFAIHTPLTKRSSAHA